MVEASSPQRAPAPDGRALCHLASPSRCATANGSVTELNCLECGACCFQRPGTILVSEADLVRWKRTQRGDILAQLEEGHFGQMAFRMGPSGACVHHGTEAEPHACRIYQARGDVCREFQAGSPQCHEFRADRGLEPRHPRPLRG